MVQETFKVKSDRQKMIIQLISSREIETQEELQKELMEAGYDVTQATVSRDIRDLGLTKASDGRGSYRYALPQSSAASDEKYRKIIAEAVLKAEAAGNLVVVRTYPGMAQAAGSAFDNIELGGLVGTIAGDDTILIVAKTATAAESVVTAIESLYAVGQG